MVKIFSISHLARNVQGKKICLQPFLWVHNQTCLKCKFWQHFLTGFLPSRSIKLQLFSCLLKEMVPSGVYIWNIKYTWGLLVSVRFCNLDTVARGVGLRHCGIAHSLLTNHRLITAYSTPTCESSPFKKLDHPAALTANYSLCWRECVSQAPLTAWMHRFTANLDKSKYKYILLNK